jgi:hypothetical protein
MYSVGVDVIFKEVIKEQPPARNLSAAVRRLLQSTYDVNQRPPFWSKIWLDKSTNPGFSPQ